MRFRIYARVRGAKVTVTFSYLYAGTVTLKGRFIGLQQADSNVAPHIYDPGAHYSPDKPINPPPQPEGNPLEGLDQVSISPDGTISQQLPGGLVISLLPPEDEDEEEKKERVFSLNEFFDSRDRTIKYIEMSKDAITKWMKMITSDLVRPIL